MSLTPDEIILKAADLLGIAHGAATSLDLSVAVLEGVKRLTARVAVLERDIAEVRENFDQWE